MVATASSPPLAVLLNSHGFGARITDAIALPVAGCEDAFVPGDGQDQRPPRCQPSHVSTGQSRVSQSTHACRPSEIAKAEFDALKTLFGDEKVARQVLNAAKRVSKKRSASEASASIPIPAPPQKKAKPSYGAPMDPMTFEASLALPEPELDEDKLRETVIYSNRAPLVLAFAVTLLKYTMPEQPVSSRLSLAQAVCSINSQSKAKHIGIKMGKTAEEEGWGEGQPLISVMGRQIRVMKRWGYTWKEEEEENRSALSSQETIQGDTQEQIGPGPGVLEEPALWGVDLDALKKSSGPVTIGEQKSTGADLPVYKPQSTRAYMLKAFDSKPTGEKQTPGRKKAANVKEQNLGMLLGSLDLLYQSWASVLDKDDLDKRAWAWYISVRPDVKAGAAGWGGKGDIPLANILELRRSES